MSVLVLGDEPIAHHRCEGEYLYDLMDWFAAIEMQAWKRATSYHKRPKEIFLVTGQHLTSAYAISHKQYGSSECEIILDCNADLPAVGDAHILAQSRITRAHASAGFEAVVGMNGVPTPRPSSQASSTQQSRMPHPNPRTIPHQRSDSQARRSLTNQSETSTTSLQETMRYSIFLNVYPAKARSGPIQQFKSSLKDAVEVQYKCKTDKRDLAELTCI